MLQPLIVHSRQAVGCLCLALFVAGCGAGRLQDPERFAGGEVPDAGAPPVDAGVGVTCTIDVEALLASNSCSSGSCHSSAAKAANLDLQSPNVLTRLVNVDSTCAGTKLLSGPTTGFFLEKLLQASPKCNGVQQGSRMPLGPALSSEQLTCIQEWAADAF
jgi:hypothetical protein